MDYGHVLKRETEKPMEVFIDQLNERLENQGFVIHGKEKKMKKIVFAVLVIFLIVFTGCASQMDMHAQRGVVMTYKSVETGTKAPDINYQDTSGDFHPIRTAFNNEYMLLVFAGEKSCATKESPLVKMSREFYSQDAPATIVEIIGGDKGCEPAQKACVLKRSVPSSKLVTLCDAAGEARREYGASDLISIYLIDPFGTIIETAPFYKLGDILEKTTYLAENLANENRILYDD